MIPPQIIDRDTDAGNYAYVLKYARPSFLRVETFQHSEDTAQHSPDCDCFHAGPVDPFNHDNEVRRA